MNVMSRRMAYMLSPQLEIYSNLAKFTKGKSVLEVGFGTGAGVLQYATQAKKVLGIEIDAEMVELAQKLWPLGNISWEKRDICYGGLGMHQVVIMLEVIEHIPRWQQALQRCSDVLLPNGVLIISTPNANGTFLKNPLHGDEWTAQEFKDRLSMYFADVKLYDFSLEKELHTNTMITPLVAVCKK